MPLDPSILAQGKPFQTPDPLQNYAKVLQIQGAQQQQKVSQMQIEEMQRDREEMQKIQQERVAQGQDPDLRKLAASMMNTKQYFKDGVELLQKLEEQAKLNAIMGGGAAPANALAPAAPANALVPGVAPAVAAPTNALRSTALPAPGPRGGMPGGMPEAAPPGTPVRTAPTTPMGAGGTTVQGAIPPQAQAILDKMNALYALGTPGAIKIAEGLKAQLPFYQTTPAQQATDVREQQRIALEQRRVELAEKEAARKETGLAELPPKEIQKREAVFPQATSAIKGYETKSDAFIKDLKALRDDPGLDQITGAIYGRTPSVSREGSRAQALYDKVTAKGGFQALQDLRDASKTGGALGNVSNTEGKQLIASFAAIDRRQAKEDVQAAIDQAIADIEVSKTRVREAYDSTYSYKTPAAPAAGKAKFLGFEK